MKRTIHQPAYGATAILLLYGLLTIGYSLVNPLFEAPDEHHHFFTALVIARTGQLPIAQDDLARQEAAQPPLYYLLSAGVIAPLKGEAFASHLQFNPYVQPGNATSPDNANVFIHTPTWPWSGWQLAVYLLRWFSLLLGAGTLLAIYHSGRLLWPHAPHRALLAAAMVAFLPQFNFLHASVTNDTLIICLTAWTIWQLLRLWLTGLTPARLFLLGVTLGAAVLAKTAGLLLLVWSIGVLGWWLWRHRRWSQIWQVILLTCLPALLLSGWLLWRNWLLYGDLTAASKFIELAGGDRHFTVGQALAQFDRVWQSMFAFFGWMTVQPPEWVYWLWQGMVLLAVGGAVTAVWLKKEAVRWPIPVWLGGWVLLVWLGWLQFMMRTSADQGRLLFPALLPLALGLAYGLSQYRFAGLAPVLALATSVYALVIVIPQAYARPPILAQTAVPAEAHTIHGRLGPLELVAAEVPTAAVSPGDWVTFTLYWRLLTPLEHPPTEVIEIIGRGFTSAGKLHTYHGGGHFPATQWPNEGIVAEEVTLQVDKEMAVPVEARLFVKLLDSPESIEVGRFKVIPSAWPPPETAVLAQWGSALELTQATLTPLADAVTVHLRWQVVAPPPSGLITFVHLGDPTQPPLAQADGPPLNGAYPLSLWQAGEIIDEVVTLPLPPDLADGRYPLHIGWYDPLTGERLPLFIDGERQPLDAYFVGDVTASNR